MLTNGIVSFEPLGLDSFFWEVRRITNKYHIYPTYLDRQAWANNVEPDQIPQDVISNQGLHCLQFIQQVLERSSGVLMCVIFFFNFGTSMILC